MTSIESFLEGEREISPAEALDIEFQRLEKWVNEFSVPPEFISEVFFPSIFSIFPPYLEDIKRRAALNWNVKQKTTDLLESLPLEVHMWQKDDERERLMDAAKIGKLEQAFEALKRKYQDVFKEDLKPDNSLRVLGFMHTEDGSDS